MISLTGIWHLDQKPLHVCDRTTLRMSIDPIKSLSAQIYLRSFGLSVQTHLTSNKVNSTQLIRRTGQFICSLVGRLDNRAELLGYLKIPDNEFLSDSQILAEIYRAQKEKGFSVLKGEFVAVVYDQDRNTLFVIRDRLGALPVYYTRKNSTLFFTTEIKHLKSHPDLNWEVDEKGLSQVLLSGAVDAVDAERTAFKRIFSVLPSHYLRINKNYVSQIKYWDFSVPHGSNWKDFNDFKDEFTETLKQAVQTRLSEENPTGILVSGGLDSSALYAVAKSINGSNSTPYPIVGLNYYGQPGSVADERRYIRDLEDKTQSKIFQLDASRLNATWSQQERLIERVEIPSSEGLWPITLASQDYFSTFGCQTVLSGHWGDQVLIHFDDLSNDIHRLRWVAFRKKIKDLIPFYGKEGARHIAKSLVVETIKSRLPKSWLNSYQRIRQNTDPLNAYALMPDHLKSKVKESSPPNTIWHAPSETPQLYSVLRSFFFQQCMEWNFKAYNQAHLSLSMPFLDSDLLGLLLKAPNEWLSYHNTPRGVLREALKDLLPNSISRRQSKGDFTNLLYQVQSPLIDTKPLMTKKPKSPQFYNYISQKSLQKIERKSPKDQLVQSGSRYAWRLLDLFALDDWLNQNFKAKRNEIQKIKDQETKAHENILSAQEPINERISTNENIF